MREDRPPPEFVQELHRILRHLYEPAELRRSLMLEWLGIQSRPDSGAALRRILLDTIQSLKPDAKAPRDASGWRIYQVLTYRFVDQSSQSGVADELALSIRQLRRLEKSAVRALAEILFARYDFKSQASEIKDAAPVEPIQPTLEQASFTHFSDEELAWMKQTYTVEAINLCDLVGNILLTIEPLVQLQKARVECELEDTIKPISGQLTTLRQAVLNILSGTISASPGGVVSIRSQEGLQGIRVVVSAQAGPAHQPVNVAEIVKTLELARNLLDLSGADLQMVSAPGVGNRMELLLTLPMAGQYPVLVLDDNADSLRLFERFLTGSVFRFIGLPAPESIFTVIASEQPRLVVLDVMMPGVDGWELLGRLRAHPQTHSIPVVVCTIMPQEALALALGAAAFVPKPVSRERFLVTLDRLIRQPGSRSE